MFKKSLELDRPPAELMIVEDDSERDPYNSGEARKLDERHVAFVLEGRVVVGDKSTIRRW